MRLCAPAVECLFRKGTHLLFLVLLVSGSPARSQAPAGADARILVTQVLQNCRQPDRLTLTLQICNSGNRPLPRNTPVSFYTNDPRWPGASRYANTWLMPAAVGAGGCRSFRIAVNVTDRRTDTFYAVVNDNGRSRPFRLPNTLLPERNYDNNITLATGFRFRATILPINDSLERGDSVRLSFNVRNGLMGRFNWSSPRGLNCTGCRSPLLHILKDDSAKKLVAVSRDGCRDTSYSALYIRPQADYAVRIDSVVCAGDGRGIVHFLVCDNSPSGRLPDSLPVSFYQGNSSAGKTIGKPFILRTNGVLQACATDSALIERLFPGNITAVVHDTLLPAAYRFPAGGHFDEDVLSNNSYVFNYARPDLGIFPADTIVMRGSVVPLQLQTDVSGIVAYEWFPGPGVALDCDQCNNPVATVLANSELRARVRTGYGCAVEAKIFLHIFPPDFTASLLESHCYKNDSLQVRFRLCMNNGYDTVRAGIPVSFFGKRQRGETPEQLAPVFYTPDARPGGCADFQLIIPKPVDSLLSINVNDGYGFRSSQAHVLEETNRENNSADLEIVPYRVRLPFSDTVLYRGIELNLSPVLSGDEPQWIDWRPALFLTCPGCIATTARPEYDITYRLTASTALGCTDSASIRIRTVAGARVNIPNVFSPNGDGKNDIFFVTTRQDQTEIKHFSIFNRNGEKVMDRNAVPPNDPAYGWDGNYRGQKAPMGAYLYFVTIAFPDGSEEVRKGTLVLVR